MKNNFTKTCPKCGKEQKYCSFKKLNRAIKNNTLCKSCSKFKSWKDVFSGYNKPERKIKQSLIKKSLFKDKNSFYHKKEWREKESTAIKLKWKETDSVYKTEEFSKKQSDIHKKLWKSLTYKCNTEEYKEKQRMIRLKQVFNKYGSTGFNIKACNFIDRINIKYGWNLQHAMNGGEYFFFGYSLDGYDEKRNIIVEYDEPKHEYPYMKKKDLRRQSTLIQKLSPTLFLRYSEKHDKFIDAISGKEILT